MIISKRALLKASKEIAKEILDQINGQDRMARARWAAHQLVSHNASTYGGEKHMGGLQFDVRGSKLRGRILIFLMHDDTYMVVGGTIRKLEWKEKKKVKGVYFDMLIETLDDIIG